GIARPHPYRIPGLRVCRGAAARGQQMRRGARIALRIVLSLAMLLVIVAIASVMILRSAWFHEKVRRQIVAEIEKATGGDATLEDFKFDWNGLRAEVTGFVLRGTEPAGAPPLFSAA